MSNLKIHLFARQLHRSILLPPNINVSRLDSRLSNRLIAGYRLFGQRTQQPARLSTGKLTMISVAVGTTIGSIYAGYNSWKGKSDHMVHEQQSPMIYDQFPDVKIHRKIIGSLTASNDLDLVLFQYQTCPFCCKVRAYLDSQGFSYSVVEVDAVTRSNLRWSRQNKVPAMLVRTEDNRYIKLTESSMIISTLASWLADTKQDIVELARFYPNISYDDDSGAKKTDVVNKYFLMYQDRKPINVTKENLDDERKWRTWADDHLVHLISPNVYRTWPEALETFHWFSDVGEWDVYFPSWERNMMVYVGAIAMWAISKRLTRRHNLGDDVRRHMYDACDKWAAEVAKRKTKFLGGNSAPNLADLAVFGILNSMEGCEAFADCLENSNIGPWFYDMKVLVNKNRGTTITAADMGLEHHIS